MTGDPIERLKANVVDDAASASWDALLERAEAMRSAWGVMPKPDDIQFIKPGVKPPVAMEVMDSYGAMRAALKLVVRSTEKAIGDPTVILPMRQAALDALAVPTMEHDHV